MCTTWVLLIIAVTLVIRTSDSLEDLLDQYVKHVGNVNGIKNNPNYSSLSHHKSSQRTSRDLSNNKKVVNVADKKLKNEKRHRLRRETSDDNQWTHWEYLDPDKNILLKWQTRHQVMQFRVEAKTRGYIGVGFSPNGDMVGADIVLGWVDDTSGEAILLDCHGVPSEQGSAPVKDEIENYTLMKGIQNDSHTILEFRRAFDTCDTDDYILTSDTVKVIWALHDRDPHRDSPMIYHGDNSRGTQSIHLFRPPPVVQEEDQLFVRHWDVTLKNFEINNNMNTVYWCKIFKAPLLQENHHIIGYEPLIGRNHTNFVHHMLLHECEMKSWANEAKWDEYSKHEGRACYAPEMPIDWDTCITPIVAWAIGSKGENFPIHVGLPLGNSKTKYYMLEVHFDNPAMKAAVDSTGLRLKYTSKLRDHDGGILVTGIYLSYLHVIPPEQNLFKSAGYCSSDCTKEVFPKHGIKVVSVLLHSHLAGRKLKLRHIRGEKELQPLAEDNNYDFNYQQSRTLKQEIEILPGDSLVTECTYSTNKRKKPTLGGYTTGEEMCLAFILHYPKTELAGCYSMPPVKYFFETLGVKEFYNATMTDVENMVLHSSGEQSTPTPTTSEPLFTYQPGDEHSPEANERAELALKNAKVYTIDGESNVPLLPFERLIIKEPEEFRNKSFMDHLENLPYKEVLLMNTIQDYFYKGLHLTFCRKRDDTLAIRENVERFPNFTEFPPDRQIKCSYRTRTASGQSRHFSSLITLLFVSVLQFSV